MEVKFNEKHKDFMNTPLKPFNFLTGAIRSGKTISSIYKYILYLIWLKKPYKHAICGKTITTTRRNVLKDMINILDSLGIPNIHRKGDMELKIKEQTCYIIGLNDDKSEGIVKGLTLKSAYVDEMSECNHNGFNTLLDRLSEKNSKFLGTTNPKGKNHWLLQEYILNRDIIRNPDYNIWQFNIWDNVNLPDSYINSLIARYPKGSVEYKRKILGITADAHGKIYTGFNEETNTFNTPQKHYVSYCLSTDYGASNVSVIGYFGIHKNHKGEYSYDLLEEYYYDSKEHNNHTLTDEELIQNACDYFHNKGYFTDKYHWFVPHDATSLKSSLTRKGKTPITYTPSVLEDINTLNVYFYQDKFRINKETCPNSYLQVQEYSWDPRKQEQGIDAPLKVNDHACDMWRGAILGTNRYGYYNPLEKEDTTITGVNTRFRPMKPKRIR